MKFIIHSKPFLATALSYEKSINEICYIPGRDTPQENPTKVLELNLEGMRKCNEAIVFWDGCSFGSMFDMGMAYALGVPIKPIFLKDRERWRNYYKAKINSTIEYIGKPNGKDNNYS